METRFYSAQLNILGPTLRISIEGGRMQVAQRFGVHAMEREYALHELGWEACLQHNDALTHDSKG